MPRLKLLPLGTVIRLKGMQPGWERLLFMITGYYLKEINGPRCNDYTITPWPLGFLNLKDGTQEPFLSCNEDAIESIEFLGAVDGCSKEKTDYYHQEALRLDVMKCPLAQGATPIMESYDDLPVTISNLPFGETEALPLGTVISFRGSHGRKAMIYQHSGTVDGKPYDYVICAWPEGEDPGRDEVNVIKHDQITAVHFRGYENALSRDLARRLQRKRRRRGILGLFKGGF